MTLASPLWYPGCWHHIWGFQVGVARLLQGRGGMEDRSQSWSPQIAQVKHRMVALHPGVSL